MDKIQSVSKNQEKSSNQSNGNKTITHWANLLLEQPDGSFVELGGIAVYNDGKGDWLRENAKDLPNLKFKFEVRENKRRSADSISTVKRDDLKSA